ncbi:MAG TPA: TerB family tellurite resistance protein [Polyangiaceae bacterium]|jgi:uncharacterized tellurite resistance protein B-like protein
MDDELAHKLCQLVAGIVITDEDLDAREEAFVERLLTGFGLDASNRDAIFPLVDSAEAARAMKELPADAQEEGLQLLIQAALADGKVVAEELEYLRAVSRAIGVSDAELEQRIQKSVTAS